MAELARRILLHGAVQGCGLRPALARLAAKHGWSGSVLNSPCGIELNIRGDLPADVGLKLILIQSLPAAAAIADITLHPISNPIEAGFRILDSSTSGPLTAHIPRDRGVCRECLQESRDPNNRRYQYPFITCAECGPRYSILLAMPFDRERTTMKSFVMCRDCHREYEDPDDRRFHAQTISCPECGPRVWLTDGQQVIEHKFRTPWEIAADELRDGKIVAVRGIGGYQLLVDATSTEAVHRLRQRKRRPTKPLAVLCRNLSEARKLARLSLEEVEYLESAANPIVLLQRQLSTPLTAVVNPGLSDVGLMLSTTALHDLLLAATGRPLVCTSGNGDGDPLAFQIEEAERNLTGIADLFLHHDRDIQHPVDESVVRVIAGRPVTVRAARGIAPLPLAIPAMDSVTRDGRTFLACGGHHKSAIAWHGSGQSVLSPHLGDLDTLSSRDRWDDQREGLVRLLTEDFHTSHDSAVCDPHPGYFPTQWATTRSPPPQMIWHHHAHVVAGMLEHGWLDREVLGVSWDGTGWGPDGTIWGGEFLRATATAFVRVAHLRPFLLPGGEAAIVDLRRTALSVLTHLDGLCPAEMSELLRLDEYEINRLLATMTPAFSPTATSCGRLFDAAACLILNQTVSGFEGHAAMCLESACDLSAVGAYDVEIDRKLPIQLDWRPVFRSILADRRAKVPLGMMAMKFHRGLARAIIQGIQQMPELPVVLGGGVFQNRVLVELVVENWPPGRAAPGLPGVVPPNDGGLAAGQLAAAIMSQENTDVSRSPRPPGRLDRSRSLTSDSRD